MSEIPHGTESGYIYHGCRCVDCRAANASKAKRDVARRRAALAADPSIATHGKAATYRNYGCRCTPCRQAHTDLCRERQQRKRREAAS